MFIILFKYLRLQSQATWVQSYPPILQYEATTCGRDNTRKTMVEMLSFNLILKLLFRTMRGFFVSKIGLSDWTNMHPIYNNDSILDGVPA